MNSKFYLPEYMIVFLDGDLLEYLQYQKFQVASLLGPWIEHLNELFAESLSTRYQLLSPKAKLRSPTQIYWVELIGHSNFDYREQQTREILAQVLEANCKIHDNMRVLKLREFWNKRDDNLVVNNRFTKVGLSTYWCSLDASFKFNVKKRDDFMVRSKFRALKVAPQAETRDCKKNNWHGQSKNVDQEDQGQQLFNEHEMLEFFTKHRMMDPYHWNRPLHCTDKGP